MNKIWSLILSVWWLNSFLPAAHTQNTANRSTTNHPNLIVLTTDGLRWQELYRGLDVELCNSVPEHKNHFIQYGLSDPQHSREKIFPFIWNTFSKTANFYGNRDLKNKIDTKNYHRFSYPGYSEMLCGIFDPKVNSNAKVYNKNVSVLEDLNHSYAYAGQVVAFTSWDLFPYILHESRSGIMINSGWEEVQQGYLSPTLLKLNAANRSIPVWKKDTRYDDLTWQMSLEYLKSNHPKILFVSLDATDYHAHQGNYKEYIEAAHQFDLYVEEMWETIQCDPFYRDNTFLLLTTDHGRGATATSWQKHGLLPLRSGETWYMEYGPGLDHRGEIKTPEQLWQYGLAQRIAVYCNISFAAHKSKQPIESVSIEILASKKP